MGIRYEMKLKAEAFEKIANGTKTLEYRLWDEKRSKLKIGDTIIFTNMEAPEKELIVEVERLYRANTFAELKGLLMRDGIIGYSDFDYTKMGQYYTDEQQAKYGVVAIKIHLFKGETEKPNELEERFNEIAREIVADYVINYITEHKVEKTTGFVEHQLSIGQGM